MIKTELPDAAQATVSSSAVGWCTTSWSCPDILILCMPNLVYDIYKNYRVLCLEQSVG